MPTGARPSTSRRTVRAIRCASFTRGLVSLTVSNGASQPSISMRSSGFSGSQISTRLGGESGKAMCGGKPSLSEVTLAAMPCALNTSSTAASTLSPERNECLNSRNDEFNAAVLVRALEISAHGRELPGRRVLERKDRLLLVADGEDGAPDLARALRPR